MRINNVPSNLTYQEKVELKKAATFFRRGSAKKIIVTDNAVWWHCSQPDRAADYLIKNGTEEIKFKNNL